MLDSAIKNDPVKLRAAFKVGLPLGDSLIAVSNSKVVEAYYLMGSIYKEELNNNKKAIAAFEELNNRYPQNKYLLNTYYVLYRIYLGEKKQDKADYYKEKILNEFPDSEFALLIKNPNYAEEANAKSSEVETFYNDVYKNYRAEDFNRSFELANEGVRKFGKNDFRPKFEFIRAMSYGKLKGIDSLEFALKIVAASYPKTEIGKLSNDILQSIKKQKNPEMFANPETKAFNPDTFNVDHEAEHFFIAIVPEDSKISTAFKSNLDAFNTKFYSSKSFNLSSNVYKEGKQLVILKPFVNAQEVMGYLTNFSGDKDIFKGEVKREMVEFYPILGTNMPLLYKKKNLDAYRAFYLDNYKKFMNTN